ncbi:SRPBCC domain-containing protein [uncultured Ruegeria sp.]|uniref:SRPBCC family protein n=1 Tax=uncultured Ruegeria sp. TaxID=259304 RepID=UPI00260D7109|nr:SRPBCC domain-containing protein [uncultured Ruegeria sp.]
MTDLSLEITRAIPHPPEKVFDAWLDPAMLAKFMLPGPNMSVPEARSDAKVGGRFKIIMRAPEAGDLPHEGEYKVIDRPNRLQFTWNSPYSQDDSTVTLDFMPTDKGTELRLHHIRFPSQESRDNHEGGWTSILAALEEAL